MTGGGSRRGRGDEMVNTRVKSAPNERGAREGGGRAVGRVGSPWAQPHPCSGGAGVPRLVCSLEGCEQWLCREISVSLGGFASPHPRFKLCSKQAPYLCLILQTALGGRAVINSLCRGGCEGRHRLMA